jgi:hypothetical protein
LDIVILPHKNRELKGELKRERKIKRAGNFVNE